MPQLAVNNRPSQLAVTTGRQQPAVTTGHLNRPQQPAVNNFHERHGRFAGEDLSEIAVQRRPCQARALAARRADIHCRRESARQYRSRQCDLGKDPLLLEHSKTAGALSVADPAALMSDLSNGEWHRRHADLADATASDLEYRLVAAERDFVDAFPHGVSTLSSGSVAGHRDHRIP